jgi:hypothetical protein
MIYIYIKVYLNSFEFINIIYKDIKTFNISMDKNDLYNIYYIFQLINYFSDKLSIENAIIN